MKYIEELKYGDCFTFGDKYFVLTTDFKKNGAKLAVCLSDGTLKWIKSEDIINHIDIFTLDKDNNIIAIKEREKNAADTNTNVP